MITMTCHRQLHDQVLTNVGLFFNLIHLIINPILIPQLLSIIFQNIQLQN